MTILEDAKTGLSKEIKKAADKEDLRPEKVSKLISKGKLVIPHNNRGNSDIVPVGQGASTKVNANIGSSPENVSLEKEIRKARIADEYSDTLMDLSTGGNLDSIRENILNNVNIPVGTVPIYQAVKEIERPEYMKKEDIFKVIEKHARDGVDFVTLHSAITMNVLENLNEEDRVMDIVSRGGAIMAAWMIRNNKENPLYSEFDKILEIAHEYDLTISIGDSLRSGCIRDANDRLMIQEYLEIGRLVQKSRKKGVQTIVEGPGHIPIDKIRTNIKLIKEATDEAPLYVLGPLVSDRGVGYDHITSAIGSAIAGYHGADFLCYVTPKEHLSIPAPEDVKKGIIASKISADAIDLANRNENSKEKNQKMAKARNNLNWEKQFDLAILDQEELGKKLEEDKVCKSEYCSMCGNFCSLKLTEEYLEDL
ncbi:MAG: Thiamine biosynthesis protein ThiC [Candidatus Methanohalarchaeum thermophilum]|uniref:Phosphomethylpyrimidine synthase n=1 Tax=Methanohalarchaeum thermophilum TaxID=1903181 RepID=A0A1Q6DUV3_METT1|nr:MAG: Thiamine biosynthesis protein ThiC [Candidatus Methanohalarchaeum thermophilum]